MCNPPRFVMPTYVDVGLQDKHLDEQVEDTYTVGFGFVH